MFLLQPGLKCGMAEEAGPVHPFLAPIHHRDSAGLAHVWGLQDEVILILGASLHESCWKYVGYGAEGENGWDSRSVEQHLVLLKGGVGII